MSPKHGKSHLASYILKDVILGGQDGIVNVLALVLGVAAATSSTKVVLVAGLAATFAEGIAMGAVAFTTSKSAWDYYKGVLKQEREEIKKTPHREKKEIQNIYKRKGFKGRLLSQIVSKITSNKKVWVDTMMAEERRLFPQEYSHPFRNAFVVGFASVGGSIIPLIPFFFLPVKESIYAAFGLSITVLFITGTIKAKITKKNWFKCGIELALIGTLAAIAGYLIGFGLEKLL